MNLNYSSSTLPVKGVTLSDQIRDTITSNGLSLYRIAKASKVDPAALTRFMQGKSLTLTSVDRIAGVLGLKITFSPPRGLPASVGSKRGCSAGRPRRGTKKNESSHGHRAVGTGARQ